ncbi:peroxiredoxin [Oleidesulfovibrio sp.]|uniref:peroxiredoxin n=1 Tax=Oleidesulfovibrio sp. TaxID=2909707 RepID=UPI003A866AF4
MEKRNNATRLRTIACVTLLAVSLLLSARHAGAEHINASHSLYSPPELPATATTITLKKGEMAPEFTLPSISGQQVSLADYRGKKNVVISFVPAAFTPVCSDQWPGYNIAKELFERHDAVILGIALDNIPSLYVWAHQMGGLWFPVLSDFWPHGATAQTYGILRPEGISERAIFVVDKQGRIADITLSDINTRPDLGRIMKVLGTLP